MSESTPPLETIDPESWYVVQLSGIITLAGQQIRPGEVQEVRLRGECLLTVLDQVSTYTRIPDGA